MTYIKLFHLSHLEDLSLTFDGYIPLSRLAPLQFLRNICDMLSFILHSLVYSYCGPIFKSKYQSLQIVAIPHPQSLVHKIP